MDTNLGESAKKYLDANLDLIALNGKKPIDKEWTNANEVQYTSAGIRHAIKEGHNVGYRIGDRELIIDVDPKNGGLKSWSELGRVVQDLGWLNETVLTPGGGFHIYCILPDSEAVLAKNLAAYPGIDFLKKGNQVVIAGSVGANGKQYRWAPQAKIEGEPIPEKLFDLLAAGNPDISSMSHLNDEAREHFYSKNGWGILSAQELGDLLKYLAPENFREYTRWFSLLAAAHFSTGGDSSAEDVFAEWATLDPMYTNAGPQIAKHWASLSREGSNIGGKPITTMTLIHEFKQVGALEKVQFLVSRLGRRLRDTVSFGPVEGNDGTPGDEPEPADRESSSDKLQRWLDDLATYTDETKIISEFMAKLAESPDLLPAQREVIFQKMKERTGVGLGTLREDFRAHALGVGSFLENQSEQRDTVTQAMIMISALAKLGGRGLFMYAQGSFHRWKGTGRWETEHDMFVQQMVMSVMEEMSFPAMTAGAISSVTRMIQVQVFREDDIWSRGESGKSDATLSQDKYAAHHSPMLNLTDGELRLNLETQQWDLTPHKPQSYKQVMLPIRYSTGDKGCPVWDKFINESLWCEDDAELTTRKTQLATFIIYSMVESMPWLKKCIYLYGKPDSGKSVILDVVGEMLGSGNSSALDITQLGSQFGPSGLSGKLANFAGEINRGEMITDGPFKSLISGDGVMIEKKGQDGFIFQNKSVFWFAGNHLPRSRDKSGAIESRMLYLPFNWTVPYERRDSDLRAKLVGEMDAIFSWALELFTVEHLKDQCSHIVNVETAGMRKVMSEWKDESDPIRGWFRDCLDVGLDQENLADADAKGVGFSGLMDFVSNKALYKSYTQWCKDTGHRAMTSTHMGRSLQNILDELVGYMRPDEKKQFLSYVKRGARKVDGKTYRGWAGIMIHPDDMF